MGRILYFRLEDAVFLQSADSGLPRNALPEETWLFPIPLRAMKPQMPSADILEDSCRSGEEIMLIEPFAKVSEKYIEKSFPEELESIGYRVFNLRSFESHLKDGFLSAGHIDLPLSTFFFAV